MSDSSEEKEATTQNHQIIEKLRESFWSSELHLTHEVEPATLFSLAPVEDEVE